jgi:hypothetical protein
VSTFLQLRTQCAARFRDTGFTIVADAQWKEYVNQAYQWANTYSPLWPWLETASATVTVLSGTRGIALPADTVQVNWAYDTTDNYRLIPQEGRGDPWRNANLATDTGSPVTYRIRNGTIEVFPLPTQNTIITIEAVTMPVRMVADGDVPVWPTHFHEVLLDGAVSLAYLDDGNAEFQGILWGKFQAGVKDMLQTLLLFRTETNPPIRDVFWS